MKTEFDNTENEALSIARVSVTDLRIGNYISRLDLGSGTPRNEQILELLSKRSITTGACRVIVLYEDIKPITLTEEWLLNLGATEEMLGHFLLDRFQLIWKESYNYWYVIDRYNACYYSKVEFVHEWQNLYFALNGSELQVVE